MKDLLLLAHRIPFPPDKGDKIRSYHLLKHLAQRYRVHLGAFVDDPHDWQYEPVLRELCASVHLERLRPNLCKLLALRGLITGDPLTLAYYQHRGMATWVAERLAMGIDCAVVYSSAMAQFVIDVPAVRRVMDFVDMDSDKWAQYSLTKAWPISWLYRREGQRLLEWERLVASRFDASLFVSEREAADFCQHAPEVTARVGWYANGVDADYFSPDRVYDTPYASGEVPIVFTGAMDYWPNADAVTWYAREVMPQVAAHQPAAVFYIVGSRPGPDVMALAKLPGVRVTGRVQDVRPYLAHARVVVAPLRIARGIQNKVLEGMAMAKSVVVTRQALEGLSALPDREVLYAENAEALIRQTLSVLNGVDLGDAGRRRVLADYAWSASLARVDALLDG